MKPFYFNNEIIINNKFPLYRQCVVNLILYPATPLVPLYPKSPGREKTGSGKTSPALIGVAATTGRAATPLLLPPLLELVR
jgi:hypothetical protein